jgi:hypothetical protein
MRIERFVDHKQSPVRVAASTLQAIDYLLKQNDPERPKRFLIGRSKVEQKAIQQYIAHKRTRDAAQL